MTRVFPLRLMLLRILLLEAVSEPDQTIAALSTTASFYCFANGSFLEWKINGLSEDNANFQESGVYTLDKSVGNTISSTLFIPATIEFNNSVVICITAGSSGVEESNPVTLRVQGLLASVPNLAVHYFADEYHHQLQWDAPFTLDITDVDPDISGYTICNNITKCVTETDQFFQFISICTPVLFSVSAVNIVGTGASAYLEYSQPSDYNRTHADIGTETSFDANHIPTVTLSYQEFGGCYYFIDVILTSTYSNTQSLIGPILPTVNSSGIASLSISDLPDNDIITAIVTEHTEELWSLETYISTFDVTAVDVKGGDNSIEVVCTFARGSDALGCYVMVLSMDGKFNQSERVLRELDNGYPTSTSAFSLIELEPGNYSVAIFDIESDEEVLVNRTAYNRTVTVSGLTEAEVLAILFAIFVFGLLLGFLMFCIILNSCIILCVCRICQKQRRMISMKEDVTL